MNEILHNFSAWSKEVSLKMSKVEGMLEGEDFVALSMSQSVEREGYLFTMSKWRREAKGAGKSVRNYVFKVKMQAKLVKES